MIIIGASSGIGRSTARALSGQGWNVVLASRSATALAAVERECSRFGVETLVVPTDVGDGAAVDALFDAAAARFGRIDAVVNTAAAVGYGRFEDVPAEIFDRVITTNLLGTANVARAALRQFKVQGGGDMVLTGSLLGKIAVPFMSPYVTSKWGVHALTRMIQIEARQTPGVHVTLISPGSVNTPAYSQAANYASREGRPPPPIDPPEKVARAIVKSLAKPAPGALGRDRQPHCGARLPAAAGGVRPGRDAADETGWAVPPAVGRLSRHRPGTEAGRRGGARFLGAVRSAHCADRGRLPGGSDPADPASADPDLGSSPSRTADPAGPTRRQPAAAGQSGMTPQTVDAVVIGAGPNGLVAANALADAGWDVLLLEANDNGRRRRQQCEVTAPGFSSDMFSAFYPLAAASQVIKDLDLHDHGLTWVQAEKVLAHALPDGRSAVLRARSAAHRGRPRGVRCRRRPGLAGHVRRLAGDPGSVAGRHVHARFRRSRSLLKLLRRTKLAGLIDLARLAVLPVRRLGQENFAGDGGPLLLTGNAMHADVPAGCGRQRGVRLAAGHARPGRRLPGAAGRCAEPGLRPAAPI